MDPNDGSRKIEPVSKEGSAEAPRPIGIPRPNPPEPVLLLGLLQRRSPPVESTSPEPSRSPTDTSSSRCSSQEGASGTPVENSPASLTSSGAAPTAAPRTPETRAGSSAPVSMADNQAAPVYEFKATLNAIRSSSVDVHRSLSSIKTRSMSETPTTGPVPETPDNNPV